VLRRPSRALLVLASSVLVAAIACDTGRPALVFAPDALPPATVGVAYQADITVDRNETPVGGASVPPGSLPEGLTLELLAPTGSDTIRISGTPSAAGSYTFTVSVWCFGTNVNGQTGEHDYTITVT
jgi:hypothetical protein